MHYFIDKQKKVYLPLVYKELNKDGTVGCYDSDGDYYRLKPEQIQNDDKPEIY